MRCGLAGSMSWWIGKQGVLSLRAQRSNPPERASRGALRRGISIQKDPSLSLGTKDCFVPPKAGRLLLLLAMTIYSTLCLLSAAPLLAYQLTTLQPGLEFGHWSETTLASDVYTLRIDLKKYALQPVDARQFKKNVMSVSEMAKQSGALAVINANFFDPSNRPLGLVLKDGTLLNSFHPAKWYAAFLTRNATAKIFKAFDENQIKGFQNGIQAGPRLVVSGKVPKLKNESSPKSAIGIDGDEKVWLITAYGSVDIGQLARWLAKSPDQGGLGLHYALNLDGGSSTQFYLKSGSQEVSVPGLHWVPVGLGVFPKK
jgi:uncharacterized protein YigE (DUF2233 family)